VGDIEREPGRSRAPLSRPRRIAAAAALAAATASLLATGAAAVDRHEIATQFASHGTAASEDGRLLFTVSRFDSVAVIDPHDCEYVAAIPLRAFGSRPSGAAVSRGRLFVTSATGVIAIDAKTFLPVDTIPFDFAIGIEHGAVAAAALSPAVFAVNGTARNLLRIDAETLRETGSVALGPDHTALALSPDERTVYVLDTERGRLVRVDANSLDVEGGSDVDPSGGFLDIPMEAAVAADGRVLVAYVGGDYLGRIAVFSRFGFLLDTIVLPAFSTGIAADALGGHVVTGGGFVLRQRDLAIEDGFSRRSVGLYSVSADPATGAFHSTNDNDRYVTRLTGLPVPLRVSSGTPEEGGWISLAIDVPPEAGRLAQVVLSRGRSAGVRVDSLRRFGLDRDDLFTASRRATSDDFAGFLARLDANGRATARVRLSPDVLSPSGEIFAGFVTFEDEPSRTGVRFVSGPLRIVAR